MRRVFYFLLPVFSYFSSFLFSQFFHLITLFILMGFKDLFSYFIFYIYLSLLTNIFLFHFPSSFNSFMFLFFSTLSLSLFFLFSSIPLFFEKISFLSLYSSSPQKYPLVLTHRFSDPFMDYFTCLSWHCFFASFCSSFSLRYGADTRQLFPRHHLHLVAVGGESGFVKLIEYERRECFYFIPPSFRGNSVLSMQFVDMNVGVGIRQEKDKMRGNNRVGSGDGDINIDINRKTRSEWIEESEIFLAVLYEDKSVFLWRVLVREGGPEREGERGGYMKAEHECVAKFILESSSLSLEKKRKRSEEKTDREIVELESGRDIEWKKDERMKRKNEEKEKEGERDKGKERERMKNVSEREREEEEIKETREKETSTEREAEERKREKRETREKNGRTEDSRAGKGSILRVLEKSTFIILMVSLIGIFCAFYFLFLIDLQ